MRVLFFYWHPARSQCVIWKAASPRPSFAAGHTTIGHWKTASGRVARSCVALSSLGPRWAAHDTAPRHGCSADPHSGLEARPQGCGHSGEHQGMATSVGRMHAAKRMGLRAGCRWRREARRWKPSVAIDCAAARFDRQCRGAHGADCMQTATRGGQ